MKKIINVVLLITGIVLILLFSFTYIFNSVYPSNYHNDAPNIGFLANDGEISLLIVSTEINSDSFREFLRENDVNVKNLGPITIYGSLSYVKKNYPGLEIHRMPAFILFDSKNIIFKTNDEMELIKFLKSYK